MWVIWESEWYYKNWKQSNILIGVPIPNKEMGNLFGTNINRKMDTLFRDEGSRS